jgi:cytochrome c5
LADESASADRGSGADGDQVLAQPREQIYANMLNGKGDMPARGMCYICSEQNLRRTVNLLLQRVETEP